MFQTFDSPANPEQGPARLAALRVDLAAAGLDGFLIPRADVHQGEYVAARDERLQWLTGFTGSAGFCIVLPQIAGVFIDGRYRTQVKSQVDLGHFTPVPWPEITAGKWIADHLPAGVIGFDPWLHTVDEIAKIEAALGAVTLRPCPNMIDSIWADQPAAPQGRVFVHPAHLAGKSSAQKRADLATGLRDAGHSAAVITLPDSICWLLNMRGGDVPRNPVLHAFALLEADGDVVLFVDPAKIGADVHRHLDEGVSMLPMQDFPAALRGMTGSVLLDPKTAPIAAQMELGKGDAVVAWGDDPARLPKACKNAHEINGMRAAHLRDGAAVVAFLAWLDVASRDPYLTEIDIVRALEGYRAAGGGLHDISFDTICGAGPNGAIIHYRVNEISNRAVGTDTLLLVDSGAQYVDGTTDITRTMPIGDAGDLARECYTRVLQGVIAISAARWPAGLTGRDLDPLARAALWRAGMDFNHGTGHGVGAFLSVHEGPQRISPLSEVPLQTGMILSNEPGYYREGAFGIRLENLIVVQPAPQLDGGDEGRVQLCFETLTFVPFDRRLIAVDMLAPWERGWLNAYHAAVLDKLGARLDAGALDWCRAACAPI